MISQTSRHALRAVVELARLPEGAYMDASTLAQRTGSPANYLGKLLQSLAVAGVLVSRKGPRGGFRLSKPAGSITLFDVLDPLKDLSPWSGCALGLPTCTEQTPCVLHEKWKTVRESFLSLLSGTSLADIAKGPPATLRPRAGRPKAAGRPVRARSGGRR